MTTEEIDRKIKELQEQKKIKIKQEKEKLLKEKMKENARKRKVENRMKFIIGGIMLKISPDKALDFLNEQNLREQDKKTIEEYKKLFNL